MKKKLMLLLCAVCAAALFGGCGTGKKGNDSKKESTEEAEGTGEPAGSMEYNADEYVELGEYTGLEISLGSYEVTDEEVREQVNASLADYPVYEDLDKDTVEKGDFVNIDYEGLKDGVAFNGGTAQGAVLEIGSNSFIPGFEDGLIGKKVGEKVALDLTFPEGYQNAELAGQAVVFNVTVNKIVNQSVMTYEQADDAFIEKNMSSQGYHTVKELEEGIREKLVENKEATKETETQAAVIQKLREVCKVNGFPEGLIDQRIKEYMERFETNLQESYGISVEDYLKSTDTTEEDFDAQVKQLVTETVEGELIIAAIAKKEGIEITDEGFAEYKKNIVESYGYADEEALIQRHGEEYVRNVYLNELTVDKLLESAKITYGEKAATDGSKKDAEKAPANDSAEDAEKAPANDSAEDTEKAPANDSAKDTEKDSSGEE